MLKAGFLMDRSRNASEFSARAGRYVTQTAGYRAFIPAQLPPDPPVQVTGQLQTLLSDADRALGRLDGSIQTLPNPDLFVYMNELSTILQPLLGANAKNLAFRALPY